MNPNFIKTLDEKILLQTKQVAQYEKLTVDLSTILAEKFKEIGIDQSTAVMMGIDFASTLANKIATDPQSLLHVLPRGTKISPEAALSTLTAMSSPYIEVLVSRAKSYIESKRANGGKGIGYNGEFYS